MSVYDIEVGKMQLDQVQAYAHAHGIHVIDIYTKYGMTGVLVRVNFPYGTFRAFQRQFSAEIIEKLD